MYVITPFIFAPFLAYRILYIKKLSNLPESLDKDDLLPAL